MRTLSIFLATAGLLTAAGMAQAQTQARPADLQRASAEQIDKTVGPYKLSDGRRAELYMLDDRLYVRTGRVQQKELLLAGPNQFASRDGKISIQFGPEFDNEHIVLAYDHGFAPPPAQDTIRLASSERAGRGRAD
jgi:hypothetical protein